MTANSPNLLYIHSDQHTPFVTGCYGDPLVQTPNLDRLAASGAIFDSAYCCSPICVPSRMSMLTGQHPHQHQVWTNQHVLDSGIPTWAHALGAAGYRPVLAGRMHVRGPDQLHGYVDRLIGDHMPNHLGGSMPNMGILRGTETPVRKTLQTSGPGQVAYQLYDEAITAAAIDFLNEQRVAQQQTETHQPFSLSVGFMLPHPPYVPHQADYAAYRNKITLPRKPQPFDQEQHPFLRLWRQHTGSETVSEVEALNTRAAYWALVTQVDHMVGQILTALTENGLGDNTLIIYTSDHGDMQGEHGLWWKHVFYEESIRVPLLMAWPGIIPAGQRCGRVVSALDVTATILDALNAPALPHSPGRSILGLVAAPSIGAGRGSTTWDDLALAEYCEDQYSPAGGCYQRMIRQDNWKLIYYHGYEPQLFNLTDDPDELIDLAQEPRYRDVREALTQRVLSDWDPAAIIATMANKRANNTILQGWAEQTHPPDHYRWQTKDEMNWLDDQSA
jgi:choline-sulfatase